MQQMEVSKWLKGITIAVGVMGALFFGLVMPVMAEEYAAAYPEFSFLYWPGMGFGAVTAAFCYAILYQFWKVCVQIGKDNSFSKENAEAFKNMSRLLVLLAELWFAVLIMSVLKRWLSLAVGMKFMILVFILIVIAVLAAALSHLIWKAYEMKKENELTI